MKKLSLCALAGIALSIPSLSLATTTGLYDTYGRDANPTTVRSAMWDTFSEAYSSGAGASTLYSYSGVASGGSTLTGLSLTQNSPHINATTGGGGAQGAGLLAGGDTYYSSTRAQNWTLTATTSIDVTEMSFQVKTANVNAVSLQSVFRPTLTGVGAATMARSQMVAGEFSNGFQVYVIEYRWIFLDIEAGESFNITFSLAGGNTGEFTRKPIDFVSLDASTVPEPSTYAMLALGAGLLAWKFRRKVRA